jgi:uncharacterized protein (TIGR02271 family)
LGPPELCARFEADRLRRLDELAGLAWPELVRLRFAPRSEVQYTVPLRCEEVRVEREPITDGNVDQALDGPEISEEEHEVVLHEERPVVDKKTVPKERVRLTAEEHTGEQTVSEDVRKERIETDGDARA